MGVGGGSVWNSREGGTLSGSVKCPTEPAQCCRCHLGHLWHCDHDVLWHPEAWVYLLPWVLPFFHVFHAYLLTVHLVSVRPRARQARDDIRQGTELTAQANTNHSSRNPIILSCREGSEGNSVTEQMIGKPVRKQNVALGWLKMEEKPKRGWRLGKNVRNQELGVSLRLRRVNTGESQRGRGCGQQVGVWYLKSSA